MINKKVSAIMLSAVMICTTVLPMQHAIAQPGAAAVPPAVVGNMVRQASPQQAAQIVRAMIAAVLAQDLPQQDKNAQVAAIVSAALSAISPEALGAFTEALAAECAATLAIGQSPATLSAIQQQFASASAGSNLNLAALFGTTFQAVVASAGSSSAGGITQREEAGGPRPPAEDDSTPPPPASGYRRQQI